MNCVTLSNKISSSSHWQAASENIIIDLKVNNYKTNFLIVGREKKSKKKSAHLTQERYIFLLDVTNAVKA